MLLFFDRVQQPLVCNDNSIEESVIAAFDTLQSLVNGKQIHRLLLRFAYIHLVRVIDIYRAAAANVPRSQEEGFQGGAFQITTVEASDGPSLLDHLPFQVFVFSRAADNRVRTSPTPHVLVETNHLKGRTILLRT